jgi:hypothetical protein
MPRSTAVTAEIFSSECTVLSLELFKIMQSFTAINAEIYQNDDEALQ